MSQNIKKGSEIIANDCLITDTLEDGQGLTRVDGRVVFVPGGVPGDKVNLTVYQSGKRQFSGKITLFVKKSVSRTEPRCSHFGVCGGCKWQQMDYATQLFYKQKQVKDALERIGGIEAPEVLPIIGADNPFYYRNKLEFTFSNRRFKTRDEFEFAHELENRVLGFHAPGVYDKIIPIDTCYLQDNRINDIRNETVRFAREQNYSFYDVKQFKGFLRTLIFRTGSNTNEMMVILCVGEENTEQINAIFNHLSNLFGYVTSWIWMLNTKMNDSYNDLEGHVWRGERYIQEKLGSYIFRISPTSFFQTNTSQAQKLYDVVKQFIGERAHIIYDLYCGAGSIGIYISDLAQKIVGVEFAQSSVDDARVNVHTNNLQNFTFHAGDMAKILTADFVKQEGNPNVVIVDPPRAGMDPKVVNRLLQMSAPKIVYVSCNAATMARDVAVLKSKYSVTQIQPVDMFPQTSHVECVILLERIEH